MIDFSDPTTWDQPLTDEDALSLAVFALNTLAHPDGSNDAQMDALDFFTDGATERLVALREDADSRNPLLRLSFSPDAIREHFEGDEPDPTEGMTDEQLREVGETALTSDLLYREFHDALVWALKGEDS